MMELLRRPRRRNATVYAAHGVQQEDKESPERDNLAAALGETGRNPAPSDVATKLAPISWLIETFAL